MKNKLNFDYKMAGILLCLYTILGIAAYTILGTVFNFPDILRETVTARFALFELHKGIIVPSYYAFAFMGILQIFISIYLYKIIGSKRPHALAGLTFGVLAGFSQTFGFLRWVTAIPYLSLMSKNADVAIFEGLLNSYFGMGIGEHLGSLFLAIWLVCIAFSIKEVSIFDKRLSVMALISGILMIPVAFEPLGKIFSPFAFLSIPIYGLVITWMLLIALSLFKYKGEVVKIKWHIWLIALIFWLINITPAFM